MPDIDGLEAARQILASSSNGARVIMLTTFDLDEYVYKALRAGASGFLRKGRPPPERLLAFVRSAGEGDALLDPTITRRLIERYARPSPAGASATGKLSELTPRELVVLTEVARGRTNAKIAALVYLSEATVKTHVSRILAKLDLRDRVQAVVLAYEEGLVEPRASPASRVPSLNNDASMSSGSMRIRPGDETDGPTVVAIFDEAVAWLVERGQTEQWGATPFSERPGIRERVHGFRIGGGLQIAEREGEPVGVLVVGPAPAYAPPASMPEPYIILLLSSRRLAGHGIGHALVNRAIELGHERGAEILRVDCWAHAPGLVRWYEKQGFERSGRFELNGWQGQVFTMQL